MRKHDAALIPLSPQPLLEDFLSGRGFWAAPADFDFWYAAPAGEWFWLHLRRQRNLTLAVSLFADEQGADLDLYNLSRAAVHGLRATIVNTPLAARAVLAPAQPRVALRLSDGTHHAFSVPHAAETLAAQWLADALRRLHDALVPRWHVAHATLDAPPGALRGLWPAWAGPAPPLDLS